MLNRAEIVDRNFVDFCNQPIHQEHVAQRRALDEPVFANDWVTGRALLELFESQLASRHLDLMARELRKEQRGFYTIGSSGHEANAIIGRVTRHTDPAFLHYRSGALMLERSRKVPSMNFIRETLHSFMASTEDPIAGGRHKVWGSVELCVIPQTSTIASHLPRALGAALAIPRAKRLGRAITVGDHGEIPADSIVICNFGDASANHSAAAGAFNATCYASHQNLPVPILYICEDNGIGISVHTPATWIKASFSQRPGLKYFSADGNDLAEAYRVAQQAAEFVRETRRPAFLHLRTVRLLGHAGTDVETEYHTVEQIAANEARDPLLATARLMIESGYMLADEVLALYEDTRTRVKSELDAIGAVKQLDDADEIIRPLAPFHADKVANETARKTPKDDRLHAFELDYLYGFSKLAKGARLPENQPKRHLAALINWTLHDLMAKYPEMSVFGEDVAAKGGVYHLTAGLTKRFGVGRVFNTLLDETSILGMAIGAAHLGFLPVPEIQYLAYVHNAIDQIRGEACSTQFFSNDQFRNPMVIRIASLAYQKGFGGHFHNDNSFAALRDIPGIVIACPARGDDAAQMLRTCLALAKVDGRVVVFLEPIALYMTKDLHEEGDGEWLCDYPAPDTAIPLGEGRVYHEVATDLTMLTFGNGVYMSLRAARQLERDHNIRARVVDLRWINPLNEAFIAEQAEATGRVLVVDEGRRTGGLAEAILAAIHERCGPRVHAARIAGHDTYIPLGPAANEVLPTEAAIVKRALEVTAMKSVI